MRPARAARHRWQTKGSSQAGGQRRSWHRVHVTPSACPGASSACGTVVVGNVRVPFGCDGALGFPPGASPFSGHFTSSSVSRSQPGTSGSGCGAGRRGLTPAAAGRSRGRAPSSASPGAAEASVVARGPSRSLAKAAAWTARGAASRVSTTPAQPGHCHNRGGSQHHHGLEITASTLRDGGAPPRGRWGTRPARESSHGRFRIRPARWSSTARASRSWYR